MKPTEFLKRTEKRITALEKETKLVIARIKQLAQVARSTANEVARDREKTIESIHRGATIPDVEDDDEFAIQAAEEEDARTELAEMVENISIPLDEDLKGCLEALDDDFTRKLTRVRVAMEALEQSLP